MEKRMTDDMLFRATAPRHMRQLMADFGFDKHDSAAVFGNAGHESNGFRSMQEIKPAVPGSRGGYGWFQWTGPRRKAFEAYCTRNGLAPASDAANYAWLFVELSGPEKKAVAAVKNASELRAKVEAFEKAFERAGVKHYDSRERWARIALEAFDAAPLADPVPSPPPAEKPGSWIAFGGIGAAIAALIAAILKVFGLI
jgi:hypothetical protein